MTDDERRFNIVSYGRTGPAHRRPLTIGQVEQITRTVGRTPEVMVKVVNQGSRNLAGVGRHVDWGVYGSVAVGNTRRRLSFFVMVQCYSRQMYVEFTVSQTMEHFLGCHERAFAALGVPENVMVDNLKSAVLRRLTGVAPVFNPRYLDYARHHHFKIVPCNVAAGNEKGRVESGVGYVKKKLPARHGVHRLLGGEPGSAAVAPMYWRPYGRTVHPRNSPLIFGV